VIAADFISSYAQALAARLSFDPSLSRRVRQEVEDHLREAAAADASGDPLGAQRRAIAGFGDPGAIAAQIAVASLAGQLRKIGVTVVLVLAAMFLAMQTRLMWYDLTEWGLCENVAALCEMVGSIDRSAFLLAAFAGAAACVLAGSRRILLCSVAAGGLVASVLCDGVLTALRLADWDWSLYFLIPLSSMAVEIACAAVLLVRIRDVARCRSSASALQQA